MVEVTLGLPSPIRTNCNFGAAIQYGNHLYVGTKSHFGAEIWRYDGTGLSGWVNTSPPTLGVFFGAWPGRVEDMAVFQNTLYVAEGFPTANLVSYNGTSWTIIETGPAPFDTNNFSISGLAVLPSRSTSSGSTGDKLFTVTDVFGGGYQMWSYPFSEEPLSCTVLKQATISISPQTASNELSTPGQTHTVTAQVNAGSGVDFSDFWVSCTLEVDQKFQSLKAVGFVGTDGSFGITYDAVQGPDGLFTDLIEACFWNSEDRICAQATKTWVDTTPPVINIATPQDGSKYMLNEVVLSDYSIQDTVGVKTTTADAPNGGSIITNVAGPKTFNVTATDYGNNTTIETVTYTVKTPKDGAQDLISEVEDIEMPQDIEDGFTDKLNAAINALNKGKDKTAINILNAFIKLVNAKSGKTLTNEQADNLIQAAQKIIDSINAS